MFGAGGCQVGLKRAQMSYWLQVRGQGWQGSEGACVGSVAARARTHVCRPLPGGGGEGEGGCMGVGTGVEIEVNEGCGQHGVCGCSMRIP